MIAGGDGWIDVLFVVKFWVNFETNRARRKSPLSFLGSTQADAPMDSLMNSRTQRYQFNWTRGRLARPPVPISVTILAIFTFQDGSAPDALRCKTIDFQMKGMASPNC
mmetsp:Transcript_32388/g.67542  ORF Transcript_32388/g.67542 Transcript_32388/m.67542 type:complete len:108 (-) Transcript_32388:339-662(-)